MMVARVEREREEAGRGALPEGKREGFSF